MVPVAKFGANRSLNNVPNRNISADVRRRTFQRVVLIFQQIWHTIRSQIASKTTNFIAYVIYGWKIGKQESNRRSENKIKHETRAQGPLVSFNAGSRYFCQFFLSFITTHLTTINAHQYPYKSLPVATQGGSS